MILVAGPAANFIFSFVLLIFINIFYGISIDKPEISYVEKDMPAFNAGLKEGDLILEIDGNKIEKFSQIKRLIKNKNNQSINLLFSRDGIVSEVKVNVINNIIGIRGKIENKKLNFIESFNESLLQIYNFTKLTLVGVYEIITGNRGTDELGGPIRIAELSGDFWSKGLHSTLWFMMIISLNLGLINLFPIPMLDGGHLLLNFIEFINGGPLKKNTLKLLIHLVFLYLFH